MELSKAQAYISNTEGTTAYINEAQTAICREIEVKHLKDIKELKKNLDEGHLKKVNLQLTIEAMDAERGRLEGIYLDKPNASSQ